MRPVLCALLAILFAAPVRAELPRASASSAAEAYQAGDYAAAAKVYSALIDESGPTVDLYFNLGTAELRAGRLGHAVLAFERALRLDPTDEDVAHNLAEARKSVIDQVVGAREEAPFIERLGERVPVNPVGHLFLASWVLGIGAWLARGVTERRRALFTSVGIVGLILALLSGALLGAAAWRHERVAYAVAVAKTVPVREGPASDFKAAFEIHEGLKVRVVRRESDFLRVRLGNGVEGWVAERDVPVI